MGSAVRIGLVGLALAAVGCDFESTEIISNGSVIDSVASATAIAVESRPGDNVVVVRTVDAAGIGSGPGNASVQIDGSAVSVSTDAFGYGIVELEGGVQTVEGEDIVTFDAAAGWPEGLPLLEVPRPDAVEVARARKGVLVSAGSQIWWTGPDLPDHPVADLGAQLRLEGARRRDHRRPLPRARRGARGSTCPWPCRTQSRPAPPRLARRRRRRGRPPWRRGP